MKSGGGTISLCVEPQRAAETPIDFGFDYGDILDTVFTVGVHSAPLNDAETSSRFLRIKRTLTHFLQLERRITPHSALQSSIDAYSAALVARSSPFFSRQREADRLASRLEKCLRKTLEHPPQSSAIRSFFGHVDTPSEEQERSIDRCIASQRKDMDEVCLPGGCAHRVELTIPATAAEHVIIVWKCQFDGDALEMAAVSSDAADIHTSAVDVDPYCEAALAWQETTTTDSSEHHDDIVLQFPTQVPTAPCKWIFGSCIVPAQQKESLVRLTWTNADEQSIFSKTLQVQAHVGTQETIDTRDWEQLMNRASVDDSLEWLQRLVACSPLMEWSSNDEQGDDVISIEDDMVAVLAMENSSQQVQDLASNVAALEAQLQSVRGELKATKSELEVSSEIYKASLETIAQLELAAATVAASSHLAHAVVSQSGSDDEDETVLDSEDDDAEDSNGSERHRLRELVASFQEQCLWRSIEATESEKRTLLMELEVNRLQQQNDGLQHQLASLQEENASIETENRKLKAQKALLVKEVKRLMPFSQVNLAALIHEAEEARMIQRSLQTQLSELRSSGNANPETEHPPED